MTNLWVTGTRWDQSKYLQCSGSSISRLVTVNILAMSQWNLSCCLFVAWSLVECEAACPPGSHDGRIWSRVAQPQPARWGLALRDHGIPAGSVEGRWKKGAAVNQRAQTNPPSSLLKELQLTSEAVSWPRGVRRPSPSDSPQRECNCKIRAWGTLMLSVGLWWVNMMQYLNSHGITELSCDFHAENSK